jgi:hypothetical protein
MKERNMERVTVGKAIMSINVTPSYRGGDE